MMQRLFLIADPQGKASFDPQRLRNAIRQLDGLSGWREPYPIDPEGTAFVCELPTNEDKVVPIPIQVRSDFNSISLGAYHTRGLQAALDIQRLYGAEIYAFSEESSPEIVALSSITSTDELSEKLRLR